MLRFLKPLFLPASFVVFEQKLRLIAAKMLPRRGDGIGRGRPEANAIILEEIRSLHTRMETIETAQRRIPDEGVDSTK